MVSCMRVMSTPRRISLRQWKVRFARFDHTVELGTNLVVLRLVHVREANGVAADEVVEKFVGNVSAELPFDDEMLR